MSLDRSGINEQNETAFLATQAVPNPLLSPWRTPVLEAVLAISC